VSQSVLTTRIREANARGRKALIPFLPGGFPDKERFFQELDQLDAGGADIIEIGVPFSDPWPTADRGAGLADSL
jgi:tryptophan synthase alpha chain